MPKKSKGLRLGSSFINAADAADQMNYQNLTLDLITPQNSFISLEFKTFVKTMDVIGNLQLGNLPFKTFVKTMDVIG